ncbi:maltokinase N-terminal cap-like domain-containing protein [Microlunatus flavus]|uniref:Maltokinase n=1 Tax=Microlunatus flavus TaxID=1036181 RepID=A0A1H9F546_9ACTN|nr:phosphotransferase [Microlunatus flavus]SEQ33106.1 maltokinase [Microlunatus flavus]
MTADSPGLPPEAVEPLMAAVNGARWFAGKGRRPVYRSFTPLAWLDADGPAGDRPRVRLAVLEVGYPDGSGVEHYQLALAYRHGPGPEGLAPLFRDGAADVYDATQDPEAARSLLEALLDERDLRDEGDGAGAVRFHLRDTGALDRALVPQVFRGQQSNTSVMYGDVAMIKLFRRLELGRNLDIQVHAALNDAGTADVATLFGWSEATWTRDGEVLGADLSMCVEKLADAVDGWDLALGELRAGRAFDEHAAALGRALAVIHDALRTAFGTSTQPGSAVAEVMTARLGAATAVAAELEPYGPGLRDRFATLGRGELEVQRVHGDFHLGQTLHTPSGWKIIDFEGEPVKSLAERVAPDSVWRDVAGMLRSFDYAAASVGGDGSAAWRDACRAAFLDGYTAGRGLQDGDADRLAAYEADKAVYEVVYEVRNRPDWVSIPLGALAGLAHETTEQNPHEQPHEGAPR